MLTMFGNVPIPQSLSQTTCGYQNHLPPLPLHQSYLLLLNSVVQVGLMLHPTGLTQVQTKGAWGDVISVDFELLSVGNTDVISPYSRKLCSTG